MLHNFTYYSVNNASFPTYVLKTTDLWIIDVNEDNQNKISILLQNLVDKGIKIALNALSCFPIQIENFDYLIWRSSFGNLEKVLADSVVRGYKLIIVEDVPVLDKTILLQTNRSLKFSNYQNLKNLCQEVWSNNLKNIQEGNPKELQSLFNIPLSYGISSIPGLIIPGLIQNLRDMLFENSLDKYPSRYFYLIELKETCIFDRNVVSKETPTLRQENNCLWLSLRAHERSDNNHTTPILVPKGGLAVIFKVTDFHREDKCSEFLVTDIVYNSIINLFQRLNIPSNEITRNGYDILYQNKRIYRSEIWRNSHKNYGTAGLGTFHFNLKKEQECWKLFHAEPQHHESIGLSDIDSRIDRSSLEDSVLLEIQKIIDKTF